MELALKINIVVMWIAFVCFIITLIRTFKSKGAKPSKMTRRVVDIAMLLIEGTRFLMEIWCGNIDKIFMGLLGIAATVFLICMRQEMIKTFEIMNDAKNKQSEHID